MADLQRAIATDHDLQRRVPGSQRSGRRRTPSLGHDVTAEPFWRLQPSYYEEASCPDLACSFFVPRCWLGLRERKSRPIKRSRARISSGSKNIKGTARLRTWAAGRAMSERVQPKAQAMPPRAWAKAPRISPPCIPSMQQAISAEAPCQPERM